MDALLDLEPRVAGEEEIEPAMDFHDRGDDLHRNCECLDASVFFSTPTTLCEDFTKFCPV